MSNRRSGQYDAQLSSDFMPSDLADCVMAGSCCRASLRRRPRQWWSDWRGFGQQLEEEIGILASALWTALSDQVLFTFAMSLRD